VARTYLVFFDWDRADLTDRARQIIGEAAQNARTTRSTRIECPATPTAPARRSTTSAYRSAARRPSPPSWCVAASTATRSGVQAFGESRPLVPHR
jgi:hypothetical protein